MRAAIVLAAGRSRRFGTANKLLVPFRGKPLLHHALERACAAPVGRVIVVAGKDPRIAACIRGFGKRRIDLARARNSQTPRESLATGLEALLPGESEAFIFLGDMPFVPPGLAFRLAHETGAAAVRPAWRGIPGHPVLLRRPAEALDRIAAGHSPILPEEIVLVGADRRCIRDIDRPGMLR